MPGQHGGGEGTGPCLFRLFPFSSYIMNAVMQPPHHPRPRRRQLLAFFQKLLAGQPAGRGGAAGAPHLRGSLLDAVPESRGAHNQESASRTRGRASGRGRTCHLALHGGGVGTAHRGLLWPTRARCFQSPEGPSGRTREPTGRESLNHRSCITTCLNWPPSPSSDGALPGGMAGVLISGSPCQGQHLPQSRVGGGTSRRQTGISQNSNCLTSWRLRR